MWLRLAQSNPLGRLAIRTICQPGPDRPVEFCGLTFPNVLGIAAGYDKDVYLARGMAEMGFGHIEVGTLTPRPQAGNPKPRVFRVPEHRAVINRMGFPNEGVQAVLPRLKALFSIPDRQFKIGVSLGKQKETPLEGAAEDYIAVMKEVYASTDYLAINISSPNTPGLRDLQGGRYLEHLCKATAAECTALSDKLGVKRRPLLVKVAPDLSRPELDDVLGIIESIGIDGIIASNTTLRRPTDGDPIYDEAGGFSGVPLRQRSTKMISYIHRSTGGRLPIIGVGGISTARDAREKLDAGATLLQVYTGIIYEGPAMAGRILRGLEQR